MRKIYPFILFILIFFFILSIWDKINFPFNNQIRIFEEYFYKKHNPLNDPVRFISLLFAPILAFVITFVYTEKNIYSFNPNNNNFFLKNNTSNTKYKSNLNKLFIIIVLIILFDFLLLDFHYHLEKKTLDYFHEGTFLTPPINYYFNGSLWNSTVYDYGLISNNLAGAIWSLLGEKSIGSFRFSLLSLQLLNKILLVFISKIFVDSTNFRKETKTYFFLLLAFGLINLVRYKFYWVSFFPYRHCIFLIFLIFVIYFFRNQNFFRSFIVGFFSSIALLWFLDIGLFINLLILCIVFYFLLIKNYYTSLSIIFGTIISWFVVLLIFPSSEIIEAINQFKFIYSVSPYLLGLEYVKPFTNGYFDWYSKPFVFFYITFFILIYLNLKKNLNINYNSKIILSFIFVCSVVMFQSALVRSSDKHIIYSLGTIIFLFYTCLLYILFLLIERLNILFRIVSFFYNKKFFFSLSFILIIFVFIFRLDFGRLNNLPNSITNFNTLLFAKDDYYLDDNYKGFIKIYKKLTKNDSCVQSFYDDLTLPYLLNKPSCTKYYASTHIINDWSDDYFLNEFKKNLPEYILYDGPYQILTKKSNMIKVDEYVRATYDFYLNYKDWIIYKKIN
ncbi:hypothetical protein N9374_03215 [Candidatus Pelagibacter sp.]|nr:hypothetical protein [Candidatus Pelagibacter sp.]